MPDFGAYTASTGAYLPHPLSNKPWGWLSGQAANTAKGAGMFEGNTYTAAGSIVNAVDATYGGYHDTSTSTTSTSAVKYFGAINLMRKSNPNFTVNCRVPDIDHNRFFIGFVDTTSLPVNAFNFLNNQTGFGVRFDIGQDVNTFKILTNTGAATNTTTATSFTLSNNIYLTINVFGDETNARWGLNINNGTPQYISTGIPASTTALAFNILYTTQTTAARHFHIFDIYGESS